MYAEVTITNGSGETIHLSMSGPLGMPVQQPVDAAATLQFIAPQSLGLSSLIAQVEALHEKDESITVTVEDVEPSYPYPKPD